jgi:preprotein translocase SecE subunit
MANKTIDRKKAIAAGSQSARVGAKSASSGAASSATNEEEQANLKAGSVDLLEEDDEMAENEEFEEEDEEEAEESDSEAEEDEEEAEEEEESRALEKSEDRRIARRERRDKNVVAVHPQDYAISKPSGSRLPDNTLIRFFRSSYRELRMVTWPTRQETWNWSLVVVGVCVVVAAVLGAADLGLSQFVKWWISLAH